MNRQPDILDEIPDNYQQMVNKSDMQSLKALVNPLNLGFIQRRLPRG